MVGGTIANKVEGLVGSFKCGRGGWARGMWPQKVKSLLTDWAIGLAGAPKHGTGGLPQRGIPHNGGQWKQVVLTAAGQGSRGYKR